MPDERPPMPPTDCPNCSKPLLPSDRFCGFCGQSLESIPRLSPPRPATPPSQTADPSRGSNIAGWGAFLLGFSLAFTLILVVGEVLMWLGVQEAVRRDNSSPGLIMIGVVFLFPPPIALICGGVAGGLTARLVERRRAEGKDIRFANYGYVAFLAMICSGFAIWFLYLFPTDRVTVLPSSPEAAVQSAPPPPLKPSLISPSPRPQVQVTNLSEAEISLAGRELPALLGPLYYPGAELPVEFAAVVGRTFRSGQVGVSPLYPSIALIAPAGTTIDTVTSYYERVAPGGQRRSDGGYLVNDIPRPGDSVRVRIFVSYPIKGPKVGKVLILFMTLH